jgi:hypothetical protein
MDFRLLVALIPLAIVAYLLWRLVRYGGVLGAMVGGRVQRKVGEVSAVPIIGVRQIIGVHVLEKELGAAPLIVVSTLSRMRVNSSLKAFKLTPDQARLLARLLGEAAAG